MDGTATTPDLTQGGAGTSTPPPATQPPAAQPPATGGTPPASMQPQRPDFAQPAQADIAEKAPNMASRVYHGILSAMGGANDVQLSRDANGTMQASVTKSTPGTQWKRIIAGALTGLAGSANAGVGPGSKTRALALGTGAGLNLAQQQQQQKVQQADQDYNEQQKTLVRKAQLQQMAVQTAAASFSLERAKTNAANLDAKELNDHMQWIHDNGGTEVGTFKDFADVSAYAKNDPTLAADIAHGRVSVVPHVGESGKVEGIDVARMPQDWGSQYNDKDLPIQRMVPGKDGQPPTWETETIPAGTIKNSDYNAAVLSTVTQRAKLAADKTEDDYKKAQTLAAKAEATQRYAAAKKDLADAAKAAQPNPDDPYISTLGEAAARGALTIDEIPGFSKLKPAIEAYLAQHHPNLDQNSVFLTSQERRQSVLAQNALGNMADIQARLQRRPDLIGRINGLVTQGKELTGTNDKDLGQIAVDLDNYALASTGAHGVRAVEARADAKKALLNGFKNGPQGVQGAFEGARSSLTNLASVGKPRGIDGSAYVYKTQPQQAASSQPNPPQSAPNPQDLRARATALGVPATATGIAHDEKGNIVGYQDASGYHALGAKK